MGRCQLSDLVLMVRGQVHTYIIFAERALAGALEPFKNAWCVENVFARQLDDVFPLCVVPQAYGTPGDRDLLLCCDGAMTDRPNTFFARFS
jgi:hypothetical protein